MKLTNHKRDNYYTLDTYVMHGTITMTREEYAKVILYLRDIYSKAVKNIDTFTRDSLSVTLYTHRKFYMRLSAKHLSLGVVATKFIASKYKLNNHRYQNYGIKII